MNRKLFFLILSIWGMVFLSLAGTSIPSMAQSSKKDKKPLTIAFLQDGRSYKLDSLTGKFRRQLQVLLNQGYEVDFMLRTAQSQFDSASLHQAFEELLQNPKTDFVIGVGPLTSEIMARNGPYSKPVIASTVFAYNLKSDLPLTSRHTTGVKNLAYLDALFDPLRDLEVLFEIKNFKKLTMIIEPSLLKVWPARHYFDYFFQEKESEYQIIEAGSTAQETLSHIPEGTDMIYIGPLVEMDSVQLRKLLEGLMKQKLPSYAMFGKQDVEAGALAGIFPMSNYDRLSMELADFVEAILDGRPPENLVVDLLSYRESLYINSETARRIKYFPQWQILKDAILIPAEGLSPSRELDLKKAVIEALKYNLDAQIARQNVYFGLYLIREAQADLLPQILTIPTLTYAELDDIGPAGNESPLYWGALGATIEQMIWSEEQVAEFDIQKHLQVKRMQKKREVELDVARKAAEAYLDVLKANLIESVQTRRLKFSRQNMAYAIERQKQNSELEAEVNRWQAEMSFGRSDLLEAKVRRRNAEMFMNRFLIRPVSEHFVAKDNRMEEMDYVYVDERIKSLWDDPVHFEDFADFLVLEARRYLPEIKQVRAEIAAKQRAVKYRKRRYYLPEFYLKGGLYYLFLNEGAGTPLDVYGIREIPQGPLENTLGYLFGVSAEYPLFIGNQRMANYQQARIDRDILLNEEENILLDAELRVRQQLQILRVAYANIRFFKRAEEEAFINLYQMQEAYQKGKVDIVRLLDAQETAIKARTSSVLATYEFTMEIINLERSLGFFSFLYTPLEKEIFIQRIITFLNNPEQDE
jgi:outer membrane protein